MRVSYRASLPKQSGNGVAAGVDRNCEQVAYMITDGAKEIIHQPDIKHKNTRQRKLARQQ